MARPRYILIDGKPYLWRDLLELRRQQVMTTESRQLLLFELREDCRPSPARTAAGRYREPSLFDQ